MYELKCYAYKNKSIQKIFRGDFSFIMLGGEAYHTYWYQYLYLVLWLYRFPIIQIPKSSFVKL